MDDDRTKPPVQRKSVPLPAKLIAFLAVLLGGIVLPGTLAWSVLHVSSVSGQVRANQTANTRALCALRADIQERVTEGESFLRLHPKGIPGITAANLKTSIDGQKRTVVALRFVQCPRTVPPPRPRTGNHHDHLPG